MCEKTHQDMRSIEAPFRRTIFASKAEPRGLLPCGGISLLAYLGMAKSLSPTDLDLSSGNNLLSTLVSFVRSLAVPRSDLPYSPGRYGENGVRDAAYRE